MLSTAKHHVRACASRAARVRPTIGALLAAFAAAGFFVVATGGAVAEAGDPPKAASDRYDPDNVIAISQYMETLMKGVEKYNAKDYTAAIDAFKKAIQLNPRHAFGYYLLGEGYLGMGNLGEAEAAFLGAQERPDVKNVALRSHVLFAVADVYERQKKWEHAKAAWQAYSEHAAKIGADGGGFPLSGVERMKAMQRVIELEKAYGPVRERIAAEKDAGSDSGKSKK